MVVEWSLEDLDTAQGQNFCMDFPSQQTPRALG
jgi:hypothetical protein